MGSFARRLGGIATSALLAAATLLATPASPATATPVTTARVTAAAAGGPADTGLYGGQDPTWDGVYRQGLTLLALHTTGGRIDRSAVRWLLDQQCRDGRWTSYRATPDTPCGAGDSNATAMAVMALHALGRDAAAARGLVWLVRAQQPGGGWEYSTGWGPDSNSTGLTTQALLALGVRPATLDTGGTPWDFLGSLQLGCSAAAADRGGLDYQWQDPLVANDYATAQATQALARSPLPVRPGPVARGLPRIDCAAAEPSVTPAEAAAGYLGRRLRANDGLIPAPFGPGADYGSTANAVLSLVAVGLGRGQVAAARSALEAHVRDYVLDDASRVLPAAAALLALAEHAAGGDPRDVDGVDLVSRLQRSVTG